MTPHKIKEYGQSHYYCNICDKYYNREHNMSCSVDHMGSCCHLYDEEIEDVSSAKEIDFNSASIKMNEYQIMIDGNYMNFPSVDKALIYIYRRFSDIQPKWEAQKRTISYYMDKLDNMQGQLDLLSEENEELIASKIVDSERSENENEEVRMIRQEFKKELTSIKWMIEEADDYLGAAASHVDDVRKTYW